MNKSPIPPRFIPTLTEVIRPAPEQNPAVENLATPSLQTPDIQEQIVLRVLQRIDLILERRLREAVGALVLQHTQVLTPLLREEVEGVVRETVHQAFQHELARITKIKS